MGTFGKGAALALGLGFTFAASAEGAVCAKSEHARGEWPTYGHDLQNSRTQPLERDIGVGNVGSLEAAWVHKAPGAINNTPIVTGGCAFVASSDGTVSALDAGSGKKVWSRQLPVKTPAFGGRLVGSPAVTRDSVLVALNEEGSPYLASLDRATGKQRWRTTIDEQKTSGTNGSVVVHRGLAFVGFFGSPAPGDDPERGGFVLIDAKTGKLVKRTYTIDDKSLAEGYSGAGIWSTPAFDTKAGLAYAGTSNPHSAQNEHQRANSLVKIDMRRKSATFGEILDSYKGRPDSYVEGGADQPACETAPDIYYVPPFSATCVQLDLDFGASPNLFVDAAGNQRLGGLSKSGDYHALDPKGMVGVWRRSVGVPCLACNAGSPAAANGTAFVMSGPPGQIFALDGETGAIEGAGVLSGAYNATSTANGLVYVVDSGGFLNVYDSENGMLQVAKRDLSADAGESVAVAATSSGVAIARGNLFVAASSSLIALGGGKPSVDRDLDAVLKAPRLASDHGPTGRFWIRLQPAPGSDPISHYEVETLREGRRSRRYRRVSSRAKAGRLAFKGVFGASYRFRARGVGADGRVSRWRHRRTIVPHDTARGRRVARFGGPWRRARMRSAFGGGLMLSARAGARMRLRTGGGPIYIVGRESRRGGLARLTVDGRSRTIDFYRARARTRAVVAVLRPGRGKHRLSLVNLGRGRNGKQVAIDAVAFGPERG
jgi:outer membrane protein assembly factor BamB